MKKKTRFWIAIALYTLIYALIISVMLRFFAAQGRSLVYAGDGWRQHIRAMEYYCRWLHDIVNGLFTKAPMPGTFAFGIGYGSDIVSTLAYYGVGDPLVLPALFLKPSQVIYLYSALIVVRPYLAGLAFMLYCVTRKKNSGIVCIAGATAYSFSGMVLYIGMLHPFFVIPMVVFPLILTGIERYIYDNKYGFLIVAVFIAGVSNYYFFYTEALLSSAYFVYRLYIFSRENSRSIRNALAVFGKAVIYVAIGTGMASCVLLPVMLEFGQNSRMGIEYANEALYTKDYYEVLLAELMSFYNNPAGDTELMLAVPVVFGLLLLLSVKGHRRLKATLLLTIVMLMLPAAGRVFNGFSYPNNRWSYAAIMLACWIFVEISDELVASKGDLPVSRFLIALVLSIALLIIEQLISSGMELTDSVKKNISFSSWMLVIVAAISLILVLILRMRNRFFACEKSRVQGLMRNTIAPLMLLCTIISVVTNIYFGYSDAEYAFPEQFMDSMNPEEYTDASMNNEVAYIDRAAELDAANGTTDSSIKRYSGVNKTVTLNFNAGMPYGYSSTQFAYSLANGNVSEYISKLGILEDQSFAYFGLDDRFIPMALANVRYDCVNGYDPGQLCYVPYGYQEMTELNEGQDPVPMKIFKNVLPMSCGFSYSDYVTESEFEEMDCLQRQEIIANAVVVPDDSKKDMESSGLSHLDPSYSFIDIPYTIALSQGLTIKDAKGTDITNACDVVELGNCTIEAQDGAAMIITCSPQNESETYLYLDGFYGHYGKTAVMPVTFESYCGETPLTTKTLNYYTEYFSFRSDWHDFLVNFAYGNPVTAIKVTFSSGGTYTLKDLRVAAQPVESAVRSLSEHMQYQMTDTDMHQSSMSHATGIVSGNISLDADRFVLFSIPYSKGWSAQIDGQKANLYQTDVMYMGVSVSAGTHEIKLTYRTPGLMAGMIISLLCAIVWIMLVKYPHLQHKNRLRTVNNVI